MSDDATLLPFPNCSFSGKWKDRFLGCLTWPVGDLAAFNGDTVVSFGADRRVLYVREVGEI